MFFDSRLVPDGSYLLRIYANDAANKAYVDSNVAAPAGANKQLQFNDNGAFGASSSLSWDDTSKVLTVAGTIDADGLAIDKGYVTQTDSITTAVTINAKIGRITLVKVFKLDSNKFKKFTVNNSNVVANSIIQLTSTAVDPLNKNNSFTTACVFNVQSGSFDIVLGNPTGSRIEAKNDTPVNYIFFQVL